MKKKSILMPVLFSMAILMMFAGCNVEDTDDYDENNIISESSSELEGQLSSSRASGYFVQDRGPSYYNFLFKENYSFSYTKYKDFWFTSGENITLNADKVDGTYPTIYLFKTDNPIVSESSWISKSFNNHKLSVQIKDTGVYRCLVIKNYGSGICANLYKNGVSVEKNFIVSGLASYPTFSASNVDDAGSNFFTSNTSSGGDSVLYVVKMNGDAPAGIIAWNDDAYHNEFGRNSLCEIDPAPEKVSLMAFSYDSSSTGITNMYAYVNDGRILNENAGIMRSSAFGNDNYDCFAWSGGITSKIADPRKPESIYAANTDNVIEAFDNYYANRMYIKFFGRRYAVSYPRYPGAETYIPCDFNDPQAVIDLWQSGNIITHASVKNTANGRLHGFSWESKYNVNGPRYFHERCSKELLGYGKVARSYKLK